MADEMLEEEEMIMDKAASGDDMNCRSCFQEMGPSGDF